MFYYLALCSSLVIISLCSHLPVFKKCSAKDDKFETCFKEAIQDGITQLKDGNKALGIQSLEPIELPSLIIGGNGAIQITQNYSDIKLFGFTDVIVEKAKLDLEKKNIYFETYHSKIQVLGKYLFSGKIISLIVEGNGPCIITLTNSTVKHDITFEETTRKGEKYFKVKKYNGKLFSNLAHYYLENLFGGNKELSDHMVSMLNENWKLVFNELKSGYEEAFSSIFYGVSKKIFNKIPIKDIFSDI